MSENQFVNTITSDPPAKHSKTSMFFSSLGSLSFLIYFFAVPTFESMLYDNAEVASVPVLGIVFWLLYAVAYLVITVAVFAVGFSMYFAAFVTAIVQKSHWSLLLVVFLAGVVLFLFGIPQFLASSDLWKGY